MTRTCAVWIVVVIFGAGVVAAQPKPKFDVASVRVRTGSLVSSSNRHAGQLIFSSSNRLARRGF